MEAVVILGILGANYLFNNDNKYDKTPPNDFSDSSLDDVSVDIPNNTDIYNLNNYADSEKIIKSTANDMIKKINNNKYLQTLKSIDNKFLRAYTPSFLKIISILFSFSNISYGSACT